MFFSKQKFLWAPAIALLLTLSGCGGVNFQTSDGKALKASNYRSYAFQTNPRTQEQSRWADPIYRLDPVMRAAIKESLQKKGYVAVSENPDFKVSYTYAPGFLSGVEPDNSATISPVPRINDMRLTDQASVDNAIALGGIKETINITITLFGSENSGTVWEARILMFVEDANNMDSGSAQKKLTKSVKRALEELPAVAE